MAEKDKKRYHNQRDEANIRKYNELKEQLPDYVDEFLLGKKFAWTTRVAYAYDLIEFFCFLIRENPMFPKETRKISAELLNNLTGRDIAEYQKEIRTITPKSITYNNKLCAVRSLFKYMFAKDMLDSNISQKVDLDPIREADRPPITALSGDEVHELLDMIQNKSPFPERKQIVKDKNRKRDLAITAILLYTGIRVSECVGIDVKDINMKLHRIVNIHRKGGKEDFVCFADNCDQYILPYLEERMNFPHEISEDSTTALFLSENRQGVWNRITVRTIERMVADYNEVCTTTKHVTPHKYRSTYATNLGRIGDLQLLKENLGHTNLQMSQRYVQFSESKKDSSRNSIDY